MASKKSTKKQSPIQQEYRKERGRIQRQINRMRKRGYFGMEDMLPAIPKKITKASVRRLKKITTKDLYDKADFVDLTTGEILGKGTEGRKIERRRSAEKAAETRRRRKHDEELIKRGREEWEQSHPEDEEPYEFEESEESEEWEREQRKRDRETRQRMEQEREFRRQFEMGSMIADQIEEIINSISETFSPGMAKYASDAWQEALKTTDRTTLYRRLAENPDVIDALKDSYYQNRSGDHFRPTEFKRFVEIIQGSPMSAQESQQMQDAYERRQAFDTEIDEGIED